MKTIKWDTQVATLTIGMVIDRVEWKEMIHIANDNFWGKNYFNVSITKVLSHGEITQNLKNKIKKFR